MGSVVQGVWTLRQNNLTVGTGYDGNKGWSNDSTWTERKESLIVDLMTMNPLPLLCPDVKLYEIARCFAAEGGKAGIRGHYRTQTGCTTGYDAECCHYGGVKNGLSTVMTLPVDFGKSNAAPGHRKICFTSDFVKLGVSIQPHVRYKFNAVLDFGR
jgi:hypothetical protein